METFTPFVRGHFVEYGAGVGAISQRLEPLAEKLTLVEPETKFVPQLRSKFRGKLKVEVAVESLEQHAQQRRRDRGHRGSG